MKYGVEAKVVAADLTRPDDATLSRIGAALEGLDVGILVNNAGMSYDHPEYLDEVDSKVVADIIAINTEAPTKVGRRRLGGCWGLGPLCMVMAAHAAAQRQRCAAHRCTCMGRS